MNSYSISCNSTLAVMVFLSILFFKGLYSRLRLCAFMCPSFLQCLNNYWSMSYLSATTAVFFLVQYAQLALGALLGLRLLSLYSSSKQLTCQLLLLTRDDQQCSPPRKTLQSNKMFSNNIEIFNGALLPKGINEIQQYNDTLLYLQLYLMAFFLHDYVPVNFFT